MTPLRQTWQVTLRYLRVIARQPAFLFIALVQPIIWLLLFGALFKAVTEIPGFAGGSYIDFLTPGVVVMLAVSSAGWTGMGFIEDIDSGVMDRMLASPVWRGALNLGSVAPGRHPDPHPDAPDRAARARARRALRERRRGRAGPDARGLAARRRRSRRSRTASPCVTRQRESLIGAVTMVLLPLTFLSSALMQQSLAPDWIGTVATLQPGQLGGRGGPLGCVRADRLGAGGGPRRGCCSALVVVAGTVATRAFGAYQRSL